MPAYTPPISTRLPLERSYVTIRDAAGRTETVLCPLPQAVAALHIAEADRRAIEARAATLLADAAARVAAGLHRAPGPLFS